MDLGTYHVIVEFTNSQGFIYRWETGNRFTNGSGSFYPLTAKLIPSIVKDEDALIKAIVYQFTEGNYSCDCNRLLFLDYAAQREPQDYECGNSLELARLTLIRPDLSREVIWDNSIAQSIGGIY